jgi:cytochrome c
MLRHILLALALAAPLWFAAPTMANAQARDDGARVFAIHCSGCHTTEGSSAAPSLVGVAGAKVASRPGFAYSQALVEHGGAWTDEALDAYLTAPMTFAPGGRMPVAVPDETARRAFIAYLKTLK